jgi:tetratricopeptide (TPR) repeat protein
MRDAFKKTAIFFVIGAMSLLGSVTARGDVVRVGSETIRGKVTRMTQTEVVVDQGTTSRTISVNQIQSIEWDGEPALLKSVRAAFEVSRYEDVTSILDKIKVDDSTRPEVRQDIEFYRAAAAAHLALAGSGSIDDAGKLVANFVINYPNNYHYWEATRLVAELLRAKGSVDKAVEYYQLIAQAPWPEYKAQAGAAIGWAYLEAKKTDEAEKAFDQVISLQISGDDTPKLLAIIGKARCLVAKGQTDQAISMIQEILKRPDLVENAETMGRAYTALGLAYRQAGQIKQAIMAFLHVDLIYFRHTPSHIEALQNLVQLWPQVQHPERAAEAARVLKEQYGREVTVTN